MQHLSYAPIAFSFLYSCWGGRFVQWVPDLQLLVYGKGGFYRCRDGELSLHDGTKCPSNDEWLTFWNTADILKIWDWEGVHDSPEVSDGFCWFLDIVKKDTSMKCEWLNNEVPPKFWEFVHELGVLAGDERLIEEARRFSQIANRPRTGRPR